MASDRLNKLWYIMIEYKTAILKDIVEQLSLIRTNVMKHRLLKDMNLGAGGNLLSIYKID